MLPPYIDRKTVHERLKQIFPDGVPNRTFCTREITASAVFTMLYIGAVEGTDTWLGPKHVVRMTQEQATKIQDEARTGYVRTIKSPRSSISGSRWYQDNSRESVRDEAIRQGLIPNNAVIERAGLPTTSSRPRYALRTAFASLFDPSLDDATFTAVAGEWREANLSAHALARTQIMRRGAATTTEGVFVTFPNSETRRMAPGPSSEITKSVVEHFAKLFLQKPAVLWISESGAKVVARDDALAASLGMNIAADKNLPDIILVDLGNSDGSGFLIVFVEVVATDGPISESRKEALSKIATDAGFSSQRVAFVTAYLDRTKSEFKRSVPHLAWNSFAWFAAEPSRIVLLHDGDSSPKLLTDLM